jgi:uncharacterized membrane protein
MNLINEKVEHIMFGSGVITEAVENKIWVLFQDEIGKKVFLYPDVFEKFLKASNPRMEDIVIEKLLIKQEQLELELREREREIAELIEKKAKFQVAKKKSAVKTTKKKTKAS